MLKVYEVVQDGITYHQQLEEETAELLGAKEVNSKPKPASNKAATPRNK